ncbi:redoxin domain-containing protein [Mycoplasma marinum]|uniref:Thioredoxin domain-containing protein n=1 Tax=Mycoplasma marinum TaxID=1937190 RepID=A0A4R0XUM1_9MOLU|nr:redoxin domain-containing protein [Mycoplasma marinum]TCG10581.1 hypothetical protein C4B24_04420 [Mycoplasma marinum]
MNKIKIKGIPFKLKGNPITKGEVLKFKAKGTNKKDFELESVKGTKVISIFPDINTSVCDRQTQEIARLANENKNITFISISMDTPETQSKWCAAHNIDNILIVSDEEYKEFADKTNIYITKIKKHARGFILLDENNIIQDMVLNEEIAKDPDFDLLNTWL